MAHLAELSARFPAGFDSTGHLAPEDYNDKPYAGAWFEKRITVDPA